jgi:hypothetical protein
VPNGFVTGAGQKNCAPLQEERVVSIGYPARRPPTIPILLLLLLFFPVTTERRNVHPHAGHSAATARPYTRLSVRAIDKNRYNQLKYFVI